MKFFYALLIFFITTFLAIQAVAEEDLKAFPTRYTDIHYKDDTNLKTFFRRISGAEIDIYTYPGLAKNRIDRIVEKVQALLDMYPEKFHFDIQIHPKYEKGNIAFYSKKDKSIIVYADRITDNILAHEISHAVIDVYFKTPPPSKVQEILSQYVDKHLWYEYQP
ncbi:MAG: hypothetical protein ISS34_01905 [Candidatus Omnitrophica bacterium]|nr:hypothetical protein [Candidatus Omnitrophota bacterium]